MKLQSRASVNQTQFVALYASGNGRKQIKSLVREASRRLPALASHARREDAINTALEKAERKADETRDLYLTGVPSDISATDLVNALRHHLRTSGVCERRIPDCNLASLNRYIFTAIIHCEIRGGQVQTTYTTARVQVRNAEVAEDFVVSSPAMVHGHHVMFGESLNLVQSKPFGRQNAPLDPGLQTYRLSLVQVGEHDKNTFSCFWSSLAGQDGMQSAILQLKPVERVMSIILEESMNLLKKGKSLKHFDTVKGRLRFDVPFHFLRTDPSMDESNGILAISLPVSKPPLLYRGVRVANNKSPNLIWRLGGISTEKFRWIRTVDPTMNEAFSRCTAVRMMMHRKHLNHFFREMQSLCIVSLHPSVTIPVQIRKEATVPSTTEIFQRAAAEFGVSFPIRYAVDCLVSQHRLSTNELIPEFWRKLVENLAEEDALIALECMSFRLSEIRDFTTCFKMDSLLNECIELCNLKLTYFKGNSKGLQQGIEERDRKKNGAASSSCTEESDDEVRIEKYVRELKLVKRDVKHYGYADRSTSIEDQEILEISKVQRPSMQRTYVRRILYTPTRTISLRPESDLLNRVLRNYYSYRERFIRVSFCDEDYTSVAYTGSNDLLARVRQALEKGIHCAGEKYVFLAFSNSQLREGAVWMYNETPSINSSQKPPTANEIRAWMGDFSGIRIPAKYAARQGQAFSSTVGAVALDAVQETEISDVYDRKGSYAFSDGVGVMSSDLARKVCEKLQLRPSSNIPSAFQVRYGGAKGILTVWDAALPVMATGKSRPEIALRPSMKKFGCKHRILEICGVARRLPMFLNRQIITLLSGMGVPDEPFEEMQQSLLRGLDCAMQSTGAKDALDLLFSSGFCDYDIKLSNSTPPSMNPGAYFRAGLTCVNCEHLHNMMYAFRRRTIRDVMTRARIPVAWSKGISAVGVMDELGVLKAGQVFCQFTQPRSQKVGIIKGIVTVGRHPCHHPGDIQPLTAVDEPALHHLVDVIVFPKTGWRPITSMLSGGDLDGDIYFCIFDERVAFPPNGPFAPMNYESPQPKQIQGAVLTDHIADFFVDYMKNDKLGQIASQHLLHSDREPDGVFSKRCLKLAEMHSVAVDFAKTGIPALIPKEFRYRGKPLRYPDFMGKPERMSYHSQRILGKLYRACKNSGNVTSSGEEFEPNESSRRVDNIIDELTLTHEYDAEARVLCDAYNVEIVRLMEQYGVHSEGEMMSGQVVAFSANRAQLRARREYVSLLARLNHETNELQKQFRTLFFKDISQNHEDIDERAIQKACAWYTACKKQANLDRERGITPLVSFPWVVADVLLKVVSSALTSEEACDTSVQSL